MALTSATVPTSQARTRAFIDSNASVVAAQRKLARGEAASGAELAAVRRALGSVEFRREEERLKVHSELCSRLQKAVAPSGPIYARMEWEQDLATNSTADGYAARPAAMLERLRALLPAADAPLAPGGALPGPARPDDSPVAPADAVERLRLLALHVVSTSPRDAERDALLAAASITPAHFGPICAGLFYMGCRPTPAVPSRRSASPTAAYAADDAPLPVDRHVPPLRGAREIERDRARLSEIDSTSRRLAGTIDAALSDALPKDGYRWLRSRDGAGHSAWAREHVGSWAWGDTGDDSSGRDSAAEADGDGRAMGSPSSPLLLVFVLGGLCHAEVRAARQTAAAHPAKALVLGTTELLSAHQFVRALQAAQPNGPLVPLE